MDLVQNRLKFFVIVIILVSLGLIIRLFQKQVLEKSHYIALAKKQYTVTQETFPQRGKIFISDFYDLEPYQVATNLHFYDLLMIPKNITDTKKTAKKLSNLIGMSEKEIYDLINNDKAYIPSIKKKIDPDTAKKIEELELTGIMLVPNIWRFYPENNLACFVLGFVDAEDQGRYGVEGYYNQELEGEEAKIDVERENLGSWVYFTKQKAGFDGSDLYLTIDRNIQFIAEQKLKEAIEKNQAESGSMIIMEPTTGKILAMASWPDFNPNEFYKQESYDIFNNPVTAHSYEPGSVFKIFGMGGGLNEGKITPETEGVFGSSVRVGIETIRTSTGEAYGRETMTEVLENSDNVGMVWAAQQLGEELFYKYIKDFGFRAKTQIDLDTEARGQVLELEKWLPINLATISFGQGIAVTPIQLITAVSAIANKGKLVQPYVVDKIVEPDGTEIKKETKRVREVLTKETAETLAEMMVSVVERGHGKRARVPGFWVAGKTGTAQVPDPEKSGYLEGVNIGSFTGFAPAYDPKFAILVKINKSKAVEWAEASAAPVFGEMSEWLLNYFQIPKER